MPTSELWIILLAVGTVLAVLGLLALLLHLRRGLQQRMDGLEESLRVYNNASAQLGRQLTALENAMSQLRCDVDGLAGASSSTPAMAQASTLSRETLLHFEPPAAVSEDGVTELAATAPEIGADLANQAPQRASEHLRPVAAASEAAANDAPDIAPSPEARLIQLLQRNGPRSAQSADG